MDNLIINVEDPYSPSASRLIAALSAEIGKLYGTDGSGRFTPGDVVVPGGAFVIAWLGEQPVGCGALRPFDEPGVAEVKRMYVVPDARGRRVAEQILAKLEDLALGFHYRNLRLETGKRMPSAIRLYERTGYARIPCYEPYNDEDSVCFEKRLP